MLWEDKDLILEKKKVAVKKIRINIDNSKWLNIQPKKNKVKIKLFNSRRVSAKKLEVTCKQKSNRDIYNH